MSIPVTASADESVSTDTLTVQRLRCEYLLNPMCIDTLQPRLSWEVVSERKGAKQSAYQVLVSQSPEQLSPDSADAWNSGKIESQATNQIVYAGKPLESGRRYWWTVRVWDELGREGNTSATTVGFWEMGLLDPAEWKGKWIGGTRKPKRKVSESSEVELQDPSPAPMLRTTFDLPSSVTRARAYVTGVGYYELSLNGERVGDHQLDPAYTDYDDRVLYSAYDVAPLLRPGRNAVGLMLGTGWYDVHTLAVWNFDTAPWRGAPRALVELRYELEDGTTHSVVSNADWRWSTGPILEDSIYEGEVHDARLEKPGWDTPGYDDSAWEKAIEWPAPKGQLRAQQCPPIRQMGIITPVSVTRPAPGVFVFDMGQNLPGVPRLEVTAPAGTRIEMRCGERLHPDGTLDLKALEVYTVQRDPTNRFQTDVYICKGSGREVWQPRFTYHGFQYVQVTGYPGELTSDNLRAQVLHTSLEPTGRFHCSEPLLNQIQEATLWAFRGNAHGIPTDCPTREKNGWTADAHLAAEQALMNYDCGAFYTKWSHDLEDAQKEEGNLPGIVPSGGWGYTRDIGPAWDSALFLIPWYMYQYYGDTRILTEHYDAMVRYLGWMKKEAPTYIASFGLGDWVPYDTQTSNALTSTAYYYSNARVAASTARLMGREDEARQHEELAVQIRKAFNATFWKPETGLYDNGSQTALSAALFHGLVPAERESAVFDKLLEAIAKRDGHLDCGILGTKYVMNVLLKHGRVDVAYSIATKRTLPSWGRWIMQGATTLWEDWKGENSLNHIMFGDVSAWFYKALAGLKSDPDKPGFRHVIIEPHFLEGLDHVQASYQSICGRYEVAWQRSKDQVTLIVKIPANCQARLVLPVATAGEITEGDKPVDAAFVQTGGSGSDVSNKVTLGIGSGRYEFKFAVAGAAK